MKNLLIICIFLLALFEAKAYSGWHMKVHLETINGETIEGYIYQSTLYFDRDSISSTSYLMEHMIWPGGAKPGKARYFENRLRYEYRPHENSEKEAVYQLLNETAIDMKRIAKIKVVDMIVVSTIPQIANELSLSDTTWIYKQPIRMEESSALLCSFQVFVHEESEKLNRLIEKLKVTSDKAQEIKDGRIVNPVIREMKGEKVVVVSFCSC